MPEKSQSFLAGIKSQISDVFAEQFDALADVTTDRDALEASMKALMKGVWLVTEQACKTSFKNGQQSGGRTERKLGSGHDAPPVSETRSNPFRK